MSVRSNRLRPTAAPGVIGFCAVSLVAASHAIAAEDASRWDGDERSAVRLLAAGSAPEASAPLRAGIEIRLKPGWHTYWRYPGDAGVPPRFDFAGSQNVKAVNVRWPAPQPIPEQGLTAIGYVGDVILPLAIVPQDRAKPVMLRVKLDYAVCEKLCVPAEATAELALPAGSGSQEAALRAAEARVPKKIALGEGAALAITSVRREDATPRPRVVVDVAAPAQTNVTLFAEGPTPEWALPVPTAVGGAPAGMHRFVFELDGAPPGASYRGAAVTLTARAGEAAIEVVIRLD
ncbi:MAG TPA: protein-disulfide reductase DsbD domain-containing protein [Xanthobacteraceae bacterium]|jgi:DsbC/DsbD-like thiol-disulfide interchange protein